MSMRARSARYAGLMRRTVGHAGIMTIVALIITGITLYGFSRIPTGFIPIEDQGYMLAMVQLPDGASIGRTQKVLDRVGDIARKTPGVDKVITIAGTSPLDNNASLSNSGAVYIILKDWAERGKKLGLLPMLESLNKAMAPIEDAIVRVLPPPPIQGIGFAAGFTMQVEMRDDSTDFAKLARVVDTTVANAATQSSIRLALSTFRADVPQYTVEVDRVKAQTLKVSVEPYSTRSPVISARPTSTSSTSSAAPSRSMSRPMRIRGCGSRISAICRCATTTATWCRSAR